MPQVLEDKMEEFKKQLNKTASQLIKKADKRLHRENKQALYRAAILSVYGWQMAIPVLLGIMLGILLDKVFPIRHFSWILNLILLEFYLLMLLDYKKMNSVNQYV